MANRATGVPERQHFTLGDRKAAVTQIQGPPV